MLFLIFSIRTGLPSRTMIFISPYSKFRTCIIKLFSCSDTMKGSFFLISFIAVYSLFMLWWHFGGNGNNASSFSKKKDKRKLTRGLRNSKSFTEKVSCRCILTRTSSHFPGLPKKFLSDRPYYGLPAASFWFVS